jgi:transposase InsO family protein
MPWEESCVVTERAKFVLEWERRWQRAKGGRVDLAELCRRFGVSRQTGYVWIARYRAAGHDVRVLEDRSSRPKTSPTTTSAVLAEAVLAARREHPRWGARKLVAWLRDRHPSREFPSASTARRILEQHGLLSRRQKRRRRKAIAGTPFGEATVPNAVWCIDFKGAMTTGDGVRCGPLTIIDAFSRFCIRCELIEDGTSDAVMQVLDGAFREYGMPAAIRSDNGPPFASSGAGGLTTMSVWLLRLGIRLERITPGQPQENGRLERFHRSLEAESASPPKATWQAQRRAFYVFRKQYNEERPHEALGMKTPASVYVPSKRHRPKALLQFPPPIIGVALPVDRYGTIRLGRRRILISHALVGQTVQLDGDGARWHVRFGPVPLGWLDAHSPTKLQIKTKPRRSNYIEVSGTSWT